MQKTGLLMTALLLQFFVTLGLGSVVAYYNTYDRAPSGLIVWGQDFSGLNRIQVFSQLKKKLPNDVSFKEQVYPLKLNRSYADIEKWLDQLFPVTKDFRFSDLLTDIKRPFIIISPSTLEVNKEEVIAQLQLLSRQINKPMRSATMVYSDGSLETTAGEAGQELDIEGTWLKIAHEHEQKQIALVVNSIPPQPNAADMSKIRDILGDYTTYFNSQDLPRTKNLRLAAIALDNRLIPPDQVFSFNDVVGERTEAAGYLPAFIFEGHAIIKGDGGGICQDSSTLLQAVRQANLSIVEKHTHSLPVSYVLKDQDATVSYGTLDFRFRNDTHGYILISARTGSNWLRIQLYGLADDQHPVLLRPDGYPSFPEDWNQDLK